jgi:hypothetical protein
MEILESHTSRTNQFYKIMQGHFPDLKLVVRDMIRKGQTPQYAALHLVTKQFFYKKKITIGQGRGPMLFSEDWEDLVIRVFDERYLEPAKNLANDYTELSQKQIKIIKEY